ncbi:alpha/beta hydrolase [Pedobacter yulinensis]|uniref:Alpha/beta hydrolase n=1 Tax=Pedobacter yulinensis TaxID=2126353 RepID=A0A2T3HN43_9SPHI|nr:alpha/beta hydrolase [Pedobacter yulinensis]PST83864.1 alpha/beta hydrolase [Pedobacter yulinensis]
MNFTSRILIIPGLGNSGPEHWQSLWEDQFGFLRVEQRDWDTPICDDWVVTIDHAVMAGPPEEVILVGHSLACTAIAYWAAQYGRNIKGALLVAPSDTESPHYPPGTTGFTPVPLSKLPFPSIVVSSRDDYYVTAERAEQFAQHWGSKLVFLEAAGHINAAAGFGAWPGGLALLEQLDQ